MKSEKELEKLENEIAELRAEVQLLKEFKADCEKQMKNLSKDVYQKSDEVFCMDFLSECTAEEQKAILDCLRGDGPGKLLIEALAEMLSPKVNPE